MFSCVKYLGRLKNLFYVTMYMSCNDLQNLHVYMQKSISQIVHVLPIEETKLNKASPNRLLVSHPIQFPPACEFSFLNFSELSMLSKNMHYVIRSLTRG